jgi:hypothetical protein
MQLVYRYSAKSAIATAHTVATLLRDERFFAEVSLVHVRST